MIFKLLRLSVILSLAAPSLHAFAEERVYYCTEETSGGIMYDDTAENWRDAGFSEGRFTMMANLQSEQTVLKVKHPEFGDDEFSCSKSIYRDSGRLICDSNAYTVDRFIIDPNTLRFLFSRGSEFSFVSGTDSAGVFAGTCETF
ncbi:MAG: hypothetical protein NXH70_08300 [Hyphomonas sp.]|nr:hypothetical protein [Hyphomonas sp.]